MNCRLWAETKTGKSKVSLQSSDVYILGIFNEYPKETTITNDYYIILSECLKNEIADKWFKEK